MGQAFSDLDSFLAKFDRSLPALNRDIALSVPVFDAYGDVSADLVTTVDNSVKISKSMSTSKQPRRIAGQRDRFGRHRQ